ncbi:DUF551 domain-containing protein [Klebsiella michiganensis]
MSILTKEVIQKILNDDWLLMDDCEGLENCTVIKELARMALSAMDSEPVAWGNGCDKTVPAALRYLAENERPFGGESRFNAAHLYQLAREIELMAEDPLYRHAQPAPVVPDELNTRTANDVMNEHLSWKDYGDAEVFCIAWNACRAAMLQELKKSAGTEAICRSDENVQVLHTKSPAQSDCCPAQNVVAPEQNGDTPAQSQGWIPVSERMPGNGVQVLVSDVSGHVFVCHHDGSFWVDFRVGIGKRRITHWMPLPAAPQEVK